MSGKTPQMAQELNNPDILGTILNALTDKTIVTT